MELNKSAVHKTFQIQEEIKILWLYSEGNISKIKSYLEENSCFSFLIRHTNSLEEFKSNLQSFKPTLIISDIQDGESVAEETLRYCKMSYPDVPFMFFTDAHCNKTAIEFLEMGATDFILKNNLQELPQAIFKALRQRKEKQEIQKAKKLRWEDAQRFKGLIVHSQDPVITYDKEGKVTYASPAIEKVLGYTVQEFEGTNVRDHIHPQDLCHRENLFLDLEQNKIPFYTVEEERLLHKDGHYIWAKAIVSDARLTPGIEGFMTNFREITDAKNNAIRLEKTLKNLTDYKVALDESSIVAMADIRGKFSFANDALCKISKFTREEILGKDYRLFDANYHSNSFFIKIWKTISAGNIWKGEVKKKAKDGTTFWVSMTIVPFLNQEEIPYQYIVVMQDISERKRRTEELRESIDLLTTQNKRLLNFSYIVSHNLRSHTSNIQSIVNFLETATDEKDKGEMLQHLKMVSEALNETMFNLNEVVSIQSGTKLKIEPVLIKPLIEKTVHLLSNQAWDIEKDIRIDVPDSLKVNYSVSYLESILHNLISNTIKYRHPNRKLQIRISCKKRGVFTVLEIQDNGVGIDLERYKNKLFGMYKTFHGNLDSKGLGLFMSKNQIEAMGGKINVSSKVGEGTTFRVFIK